MIRYEGHMWETKQTHLKRSQIQDVAKVGLQLWVCKTEFIPILFIYLWLFHMKNHKPILHTTVLK